LPQVDCAPDLTRNAVLFGRGAGKRVVKANGLRATGVKAKSVRAGGIQPPQEKSVRAGGIQPPQEEDQRTGET